MPTPSVITGAVRLVTPDESGGALSYARLELTTDYTVTVGASDAIPWDRTVADTDSYVGLDFAGRVIFTVPTTDVYIAEAEIGWFMARKAAAPRKVVTAWLANGITTLSLDVVTLEPSAIANGYTEMLRLATGPIPLTAGDVIGLAVSDQFDPDTVLAYDAPSSGGTHWTIRRIRS